MKRINFNIGSKSEYFENHIGLILEDITDKLAIEYDLPEEEAYDAIIGDPNNTYLIVNELKEMGFDVEPYNMTPNLNSHGIIISEEVDCAIKLRYS